MLKKTVLSLGILSLMGIMGVGAIAMESESSAEHKKPSIDYCDTMIKLLYSDEVLFCVNYKAYSGRISNDQAARITEYQKELKKLRKEIIVKHDMHQGECNQYIMELNDLVQKITANIPKGVVSK